MSKYTTEVRFICETAAGLDTSEGYLKTTDIINKARPTIFDFDYPIFDESYRSVLETKIIRHFYTREIAAETVGLWKLWLEARMNEIMPYYNQLYKSELLEFNPFYDVDLTKDFNKKKNENGNTDTTYTDNTVYSKNEKIDTEHTEEETYSKEGNIDDNGSSNKNGNATVNENNVDTIRHEQDRWEYFSDTPQEGIDGVANLRYLSNAKHITDKGSGGTNSTTKTGTNVNTEEITNSNNRDYDENGNREISASTETTNKTDSTNKNNGTNNTVNVVNGIEDYIEHIKGKTPGVSYSKMLNEFRETMLNIDLMVINELNDLFFNLW